MKSESEEYQSRHENSRLQQPTKRNSPYTLLVNSSDDFEDCWPAFFFLLSKFWKDLSAPILLNTERKSWQYPGLEIKSSRVQGVDSHRLTWSECLIRALDQITTPLVLYVQEDYFLEAPVGHALIEELAGKMMAEPEIEHIGITCFGSHPPFFATTDSRLWRIGQKSRYRICTQAGLWRTAALRSYLQPSENGWMFEIYGTRRARRSNRTFLTVNRDLFSNSDSSIFFYTHTGILKGQWHPAMPGLFKLHGLSMDFSKRGIYKEKSTISRKIETARRLIQSPLLLWNGLRGR